MVTPEKAWGRMTKGSISVNFLVGDEGPDCGLRVWQLYPRFVEHLITFHRPTLFDHCDKSTYRSPKYQLSVFTPVKLRCQCEQELSLLMDEFYTLTYSITGISCVYCSPSYPTTFPLYSWWTEFKTTSLLSLLRKVFQVTQL